MARGSPRKLAIVQDGRGLTYDQWRRGARALAARLVRAGLGEGRTIALQLPNGPEFATALLGAWQAGAAVLPLDPGITPSERDSYCRRAGAAGVLTADDPLIRGPDEPTPSPAPATPGLAPEATALLLLSSGSTGEPKLVRRTWARVRAAAGVFETALPCTAADRVLGVLPFYHAAGLFNVLLASLHRGATLFVEPFSPRTTAATIQREGITMLAGSPFMYRLLGQTRFASPPDFSSLRIAYAGTSAMSMAILEAFQGRFGVAITQGYGTTETNAVAVTRPGQRVDRPGLVGRPYPGISVSIRDDAGEPLPPGAEGTVWIHSPGAALDYLGDPQATAQTFRDGWVVTGDVGRLHESGDLEILGRRRAMLNVAGRKVAPAEVEACLRGHGAVAEAAVSGAPGPDGYDRIVARVVATGPVTVQELRDFCAARLADFKLPRQIEFVESLARGALGKVALKDPPGPGGRAS